MPLLQISTHMMRVLDIQQNSWLPYTCTLYCTSAGISITTYYSMYMHDRHSINSALYQWMQPFSIGAFRETPV